jgi:hypothetical protein
MRHLQILKANFNINIKNWRRLVKSKSINCFKLLPSALFFRDQYFTKITYSF